MYRYWKIVWKNFRLQLLYIPFLKHLNFCQLFWMCFKVFLRSFTNPFDIENSHFRCEIFLFFSCFMLYLHILNPLENCSYIHKRVIWNSLHRTAFRLCTHIIHVYGKITKALPYILNKSNYNTYYVHERYITKYKQVGKLDICFSIEPTTGVCRHIRNSPEKLLDLKNNELSCWFFDLESS